jgi:hypothetical protein
MAGIGDPGAQLLGDLVALIGQDVARGERVARPCQTLDQHVAGLVLGQAARVRHGQHGDADRVEGAAFVDAAHGVPPKLCLERQEVRPGLPLGRRVAQQVGRVEHRQRGAAQASSQLPRIRVMPRLPRRPKHAQLPIRIRTSGAANSTCRRTKGCSIAISSGVGSRFCGGRQGSMLVM